MKTIDPVDEGKKEKLQALLDSAEAEAPAPTLSKKELKGYQQVIKKAMEVIERLGWVQGSYHTESGVCAVGALRCGAGGPGYMPMEHDSDYVAAVHAVGATLAKRNGLESAYKRMHGHGHAEAQIIFWNDMGLPRVVGKQVVLNLFQEAMKDQEGEG